LGQTLFSIQAKLDKPVEAILESRSNEVRVWEKPFFEQELDGGD
jgi:hypothetical protein